MSIIEDLQADIKSNQYKTSQLLERFYNILQELQIHNLSNLVHQELNGYQTDFPGEHRVVKPNKIFKRENKRDKNQYVYTTKSRLKFPTDNNNPYAHIMKYIPIPLLGNLSSRSQKGIYIFYASIQNLENFSPEDLENPITESILFQIEKLCQDIKIMMLNWLKKFIINFILGENGTFSQKEKDTAKQEFS